ncbi:Protein of unknown function DUF599 - like 8 [Theobroma cacao]|nr:Protein of unknown function DUF599 - like 8 [Theobroma cacao]
MAWTKEYLDLVLIPSGLLIMSTYHVFLLYRCLKLPQTTVIGYENHFKKAWVERMLQVEAKDRGLALTTINSTISAATFLATISLALSSLIGTWTKIMVWKECLDVVLVPSGLLFMSAYHVFLLYRCLKFPQTTVIGYENHTRRAWVERMLQVEAKDKGLSLAAINGEISAATFMATISLALSSLIGTWLGSSSHNVVIWGSACWSVGLRAIYYATTLLLWIFSPLPMFVASVIMVLLLHMLDRNVTPLHKFEPTDCQNLFRKVDEESTLIAKVTEQHD